MTEPHTTVDDPPPSAADALAIIRREQARTGSGLMPNLAAIYGAWGLAWLVAGILYFTYQLGHLDGRTTALVAIGLGVVATVVSIAATVRIGRGVRSKGNLQGPLYGWSWTIGMTAMGVLVGSTANAMPEPLKGTLIPALFVFVAGVLYLAGGAVWTDLAQYGIGVWIIAVAVASVVIGQPGNALVLGVGGGGGFLVAAAWYARSGRIR